MSKERRLARSVGADERSDPPLRNSDRTVPQAQFGPNCLSSPTVRTATSVASPIMRSPRSGTRSAKSIAAAPRTTRCQAPPREPNSPTFLRCASRAGSSQGDRQCGKEHQKSPLTSTNQDGASSHGKDIATPRLRYLRHSSSHCRVV